MKIIAIYIYLFHLVNFLCQLPDLDNELEDRSAFSQFITTSEKTIQKQMVKYEELSKDRGLQKTEDCKRQRTAKRQTSAKNRINLQKTVLTQTTVKCSHVQKSTRC